MVRQIPYIILVFRLSITILSAADSFDDCIRIDLTLNDHYYNYILINRHLQPRNVNIAVRSRMDM